ncbi:hypothetical protein Tco_0045965 [Tanacetum coccineum]
MIPSRLIHVKCDIAGRLERVLVSCKEEADLPLSPVMDSAIRIFKPVNGFPKNEDDAVSRYLQTQVGRVVDMQTAGSWQHHKKASGDIHGLDNPLMHTDGYTARARAITSQIPKAFLYGRDPVLLHSASHNRSAELLVLVGLLSFNSDEALLGISNKRRETDHVTDFTEFKSQFSITYSNIRLVVFGTLERASESQLERFAMKLAYAVAVLCSTESLLPEVVLTSSFA